MLTRLAACLASVVVSACATVPRVAPIPTFSLPQLEERLPNGMRVIVLPDPTISVATLDLRIDVGSVHDPAGKGGLAHLVEHLVYRKRAAGPARGTLWDVYRSRAASWNAVTSWDYTHHFAVTAPESLEDLLRQEAVRLSGDCGGISRADFEREREVVRQELRLRGNEDRAAPRLLLESLYGHEHPYARVLTHDEAQLDAISYNDACAFLSWSHEPSRATLVLGGRLTVEEMRRLRDAYLAPIPVRRAEVPAAPAPAASGPRPPIAIGTNRWGGILAFPMPPRHDVRTFAAPFLLAAYPCARHQWRSFVVGGDAAPVLVLVETGWDEASADDVLKSMRRCVNRLTEDVGDETLEVFRRAYLRGLAYELQGPERRGFMAAELAQHDVTLDQVTHGLKDAGEAEDLLRAVAKLLAPERAIVAKMRPGRAGATDLDVAKAAPAPPSSPHLPDEDDDPADEEPDFPAGASLTSRLEGARSFTLDNGLRVILLARPALVPTMAVRLVVHSGWTADPERQEGLAWAAISLLHREEARRAQSYGPLDRYRTDPLVEIGAVATSIVNPDATSFLVEALDTQLDDVLELLRRWIVSADFDDADYLSMRRWVAGREGDAAQRVARAYLSAIRRGLFGAGDPRTRLGTPTLASAGAIQPDDVRRWRARNLTPDNSTLIVAGNVEPAMVEAVVRRRLGAWRRGSAAKPAPEAPRPTPAPRHVALDVGAIDGLLVNIAYPLVEEGRRDAADLVLGELLAERAEKVRTRLGASYGVDDVGVPAYFALRGVVDGDRAGEVLASLRADLARLTQPGAHPGLARARAAALRKLLVGHEDVGELTGDLARVVVAGRQPADISRLAAEVAAVPPEAVRARAQVTLAPEREVIVVVGARAALEKALAKAGIVDAVFEIVP